MEKGRRPVTVSGWETKAVYSNSFGKCCFENCGLLLILSFSVVSVFFPYKFFTRLPGVPHSYTHGISSCCGSAWWSKWHLWGWGRKPFCWFSFFFFFDCLCHLNMFQERSDLSFWPPLLVSEYFRVTSAFLFLRMLLFNEESRIRKLLQGCEKSRRFDSCWLRASGRHCRCRQTSAFAAWTPQLLQVQMTADVWQVDKSLVSSFHCESRWFLTDSNLPLLALLNVNPWVKTVQN